MRVVVCLNKEDNTIYDHFGRSEYFKVFDIEDETIIRSAVVSTNGVGHGALVGVLANMNADAVIVGGIGMGAANKLEAASITLYGGCTGDADEAVEALLKGTLVYDKEAPLHHSGCGCHH